MNADQAAKAKRDERVRALAEKLFVATCAHNSAYDCFKFAREFERVAEEQAKKP